MAIINHPPTHQTAPIHGSDPKSTVPDHPKPHQSPSQKPHPIPQPGPPIKQQPQPKPKPSHNMSDDQNNALRIHNDARNEATQQSGHARATLVWDDQLANDATAYAQHLASANQGLQHSSGDQRPNAGENLYWSKPNGSMADASQGWVNEKQNYHGEKIGEGDFGSYGHYTQVIWPTTLSLGIGMARADDGGWFIVGRYSPPGNWSGQDAFTGS
ncbi:MAG: hypothetical protein LQ352_002771 [Teloschistes flavicans]|nr:MAG: hypothetical protein LQ352_002771 [Teloschistes flavicans]